MWKLFKKWLEYEEKMFYRWFLYVSKRRAHRETIKQLNRMTDRQLADVGLKREDIDKLIWLKEDKAQRGDGNAD